MEEESESGVSLLSWRWSEFDAILMTLTTLLVAGLLKILFTRKLGHVLPESCSLILVGMLFGLFVHNFADVSHLPQFTPQLFFHVLLPPIIVDASFTLYNRRFMANLGSVLLFAVVGTLINAFALALALHLLNSMQMLNTLSISVMNLLIFSALISAVDPVAVLAIFEEVGVHPDLYFMVLGESLLNDGVTVVLYNTMVTLMPMEPNIPAEQFVLAALSFFIITIGGLIIGLLTGLMSSLMLRFTDGVRDTQPFFVFGSAYLAYFSAECLHWSGIIAVLGCGIALKRYGFLNISQKSYTTVKYGARTMSAFADALIFIFLGVSTVTHKLELNFAFTIWVIVLILVIRFVVVFGLSLIINGSKKHPILIKDQLIMAYGGLRGAVSFSLANILEESNEFKSLFMATTLAVVCFTVFVQGSTIKMAVHKLRVNKAMAKNKSIAALVNEKTIDHVVAGVESVVGKLSRLGLLQIFIRIESKFIKPLLLRRNVCDRLTLTATKLELENHFARLYGPTLLAHQKFANNTPIDEERALDPTEAENDDCPTKADDIVQRRVFRRAVSMNEQTQRYHVDHRLEMCIASNDDKDYLDDNIVNRLNHLGNDDEGETIRQQYLSAKMKFKHSAHP